MLDVYRLRLRDPARPPQAVIERLRQELPDVVIGGDGTALVLVAQDPSLGDRVRLAVKRVCGDPAWHEHFCSLNGDPE